MTLPELIAALEAQQDDIRDEAKLITVAGDLRSLIVGSLQLLELDFASPRVH